MRAQSQALHTNLSIMKILQVHNRYEQLGGEDTVLELEKELLTSHGHTVDSFGVSNEDLDSSGIINKVKLGAMTLWSQKSYRAIGEYLESSPPDIVHVHNTFPQLSPSIYWAIQKKHIPIVQTLHNYRLTCANGLLMRQGKPCELCVDGFALPALKHKCYRDNILSTGALVGMQQLHKTIGTFKYKIDRYIALSNFAKDIMVRAGLPEEKILVKPNFVSKPNIEVVPERKKQVMFLGRLAYEKGVDLLLDAWKQADTQDYKLLIVGDGENRGVLEEQAKRMDDVEFVGWLERPRALAQIAASEYLVMPSRWYEGLSMVLLESLSLGTPVIVPNVAAFLDVVTPQTGFFFDQQNPNSLIPALEQALQTTPEVWQAMSQANITRHQEHYSPEVNYKQLIEIYESLLS